MPRLTEEIKPLLQAVATDVGLAWFTGLDDDEDPIPLTVYTGAPRTVVSLPYAVVQLEDITSAFETMRTVNMDVSIKIYGFFKIANGTDNLDILKLTRADELITKLEANSNYGTLASLPIVKNVSFPDVEDEDWYQVEVTFGCQSSGDWGA